MHKLLYGMAVGFAVGMYCGKQKSSMRKMCRHALRKVGL